MPHPGGRPKTYGDEIIANAERYLEAAVDEIYEFHKTRGEKSDSYDRKVKVKLPTIEGLALYLDVNRETLYEWEKIYPEFSNIIKRLREKQVKSLIENSLSGDYNPLIAKLLLGRHGYVEKQESDVTSGGEKIATISYIVPDVKNADNSSNA